jgi:hypothetical protein
MQQGGKRLKKEELFLNCFEMKGLQRTASAAHYAKKKR